MSCGDPEWLVCPCNQVWNGVTAAPRCPYHGEPAPAPSWTWTGTSTWPPTPAPLTDDDIKRIAKELARLLREEP